MALTRSTGKHRAPSRATLRGANIARAATLATTGVCGSLATPALVAESTAPAASSEDTGTFMILAADAEADSLADEVADQAVTQKREAIAREEAAEEARRKAEAREREAQEARERAAREAERERLMNTYQAPVSGGVSTAYQTGGAYWSSGSHSGIDFHASYGTSVVSVGAGTVVEAGWGGAYGNNVVIRMNDGSYTQYGHLAAVHVAAGQSVLPGQQIGLAGSTGNSTGAHLHFEARTGAEYGSDVDPVAYLRSHGVHV
ncbi:M23 family metallopeptidase [Streptomyces clavuligerus]|uniref:M23 family metallopeptidase n=1 Tax=Streptomyces clavuligerus TaxID=1901 RepID=UPI0008108E5A|nr:M23 family metallopeptidase [Streptomyces clavuligerus]ANW17693.1 peptidase [Streptomyces clavuligerus]AXU12243.1 M23 family peptidase [Streptomyces clavuligerus]QPL62334.1 M23 family metallopeptidase [Streptomyces clavuligerus]QPL68368.1 M23 family metallopeptidase [Streptomyces clavuligerus]QPL74445.1 M23 family metallopeptidase [Streptomyces clavuligerus]